MPDSRAIGDIPNENNAAVNSGKNYLLAIGISDYENFSKLPNGKKDVVDLHKVLTENFEFENELTTLLTDDNATRENITDELHELSAKLTVNDRLLIYYSGHGLMSGERGFWIPKEARRQKLGDYVSNEEVRAFIKNIKARHILLISDSCFSASLFVRDASRKAEKDISWLDKKASRWVFISGKGEVSDGKPGENSPFAKNIINQLLESKADDLNIAKIADSVRKVVRFKFIQEAEASPLFEVGHDGGEFVFVRKRDEVALKIEKEKQAYEFAKSNPTIHNLNNFLDDFPNSPYEAEFETLLEEVEQREAFEEVKRIRTTISCRNFIKKFPDSIFIIEVNKLKDEILLDSKINIPEAAILKPTIDIPKIEIRLPFEPEMIFVEGGTFKMGTYYQSDYTPLRNVMVDSFYIGKYSITQSQWQAVMGNNPSKFKGANLPVEQVSWDDIQEYLKKLNEKTGKKYDLPTEAEWEFAARGGIKSKNFRFIGSDDIKIIAWYLDNSGKKTHEVGLLKPNELDIYDMSGNVYELCRDWYNIGFYKNRPDPDKNPMNKGPYIYRVIRGGSWSTGSYGCNASSRYNHFPTNRLNEVGFRVAQ